MWCKLRCEELVRLGSCPGCSLRTEGPHVTDFMAYLFLLLVFPSFFFRISSPPHSRQAALPPIPLLVNRLIFIWAFGLLRTAFASVGVVLIRVSTGTLSRDPCFALVDVQVYDFRLCRRCGFYSWIHSDRGCMRNKGAWLDCVMAQAAVG